MTDFQIYGSPRMYLAHGEEVDREEFILAIRAKIEDLQELLKAMKNGEYPDD